MHFSEHHSILRAASDDWFDPIYEIDTRLFVDPFLVFQDSNASWAGAHDAIVGHFQQAFELLAAAGCNPRAQQYTSALRMLRFPEPSETCLGYTARGTGGSGSGGNFAKLIASAMCDAIGRGVRSLRHFEELGILEEGIGRDRISDIATTILKPQLVDYTQRVAGARGVTLAPHDLRAGRFDQMRKGFVKATVSLPTNPITGGPVLLVPERFLRDLPSVNAHDWWDDMRGTELRDEFNADVMGRVRKRDIVRIARRYPDKVAAWVRARENTAATPYDLVNDPNGVYQWAAATKQYARKHPALINATDEDEFAAVIETIIERFRHFIEQCGGWRLLWDGDREKPEEAAQLVFFGIARAYCQANNINVDREVELGRGSVDFKFSSGFEARALLEVKKIENGRFWDGLRRQLPSYLSSDRARDGWLLAIRFRNAGVAKERAAALPVEVLRTSKELDLNLRFGIVDARPKKSASKLTHRDASMGA